jgi:glycerol-3-phosphate acyltransferase PlsX
MIIAVDAMGGDFAPRAVVEGALMAKVAVPTAKILLIGDRAVISKHLADLGAENALKIVHADEVIEMSDHPTKAFSHKPNSSIAVGFGLLKAGEADAFCSAGNTGAMMVGAMFSLKTIEGILRPAIAGFIPKTNGSFGVMLDVGANADVKPEHMVQFAELGSLYAHHVLGVESPKVGLMNLGEEESKGTLLTQATYQALKINTRINFIGNIEGRDVFNDKADVLVTDGFTGNVILKMGESIYDTCLDQGIPTDGFFGRLNYEEVGGSPIIGVNGSVIIGHGVSTPKAICNMIDQSEKLAASGLHLKVKASLNEYSV